MNITVEISPGELFDKITILEIKMARISEAKKLSNLKKDYTLLTDVRDKNISTSDKLGNLVTELKAVNLRLWIIEDDIRDCERIKTFDKQFVALARSVYKTNDQRAALKGKINTLLNSSLFEEKSYAPYA